jgi:hypothetical protein
MAEQSGHFAIGDALPDGLHPKLISLVHYHFGLVPGPGLLPGRQHFDPVAVPSLLPHLWLVDVVPDDARLYRVRLVGSGLVSAGATIRRGAFIVDSATGAVTHMLFEVFGRVRETRQLDWRRSRPLMRGVQHVQGLERIILPFAADGSTVDMFLCMTLFYWSDGRVT